MDRWDERPKNMEAGNGAYNEALTPSGVRSKWQMYYDWAFVRGSFVLMIGRWWWFLSAAAWHALLRAAPLGVDAVASIVILGCSSRNEARLFSHESWRTCCGAGPLAEPLSSKHRIGALLGSLGRVWEIPWHAMHPGRTSTQCV